MRKNSLPAMLRTALIGAGQGLLVAAFGAAAFKTAPRGFLPVAAGAILLLVAAGVAISLLEAPRPKWRALVVPLGYAPLAVASGFTLAVPLAVLAWPQFAGPYALAAFALGALAWFLRCAVLGYRAWRRAQPVGGRAAFAAFLALGFPLPGWLLGWGGGTLGAFSAAFALQFAGLLAERWVSATQARRDSGVLD